MINLCLFVCGLDDAEVLWGDWRLNDDPDNPEENADHMGRSPLGPHDDYMLGKKGYDDPDHSEEQCCGSGDHIC
jgi:hypothetical protein